MKATLVLCLFLASAAFAANEQFMKDLDDFEKLIPIDELIELERRYEEKPEFMDVLRYVFESQEFKDILVSLEQVPEYVEYLKFLDEAGLDIFEELRLFYEIVGLPPPNIPMPHKYQRSLQRGIIDDYCKEFSALLPKEAIKEMHEKKLQESEAFKYFKDRVTSDEGVSIMHNLMNVPAIESALATFAENGLEVTSISFLIAEMFGFM